MIKVQERFDSDGWGPWSVKGDVIHVQPPVSVISKVLAIRLHLDDCPADSGALRYTRQPPTWIPEPRANKESTGRTGSGLPGSKGRRISDEPITLAFLAPSKSPNSRRVIHLESAATNCQSLFAGAIAWPRPSVDRPASFDSIARPYRWLEYLTFGPTSNVAASTSSISLRRTASAHPRRRRRPFHLPAPRRKPPNHTSTLSTPAHPCSTSSPNELLPRPSARGAENNPLRRTHLHPPTHPTTSSSPTSSSTASSRTT